MKFFDYIGISEDEFIAKYLETGLITQSLHKDFPLALFTYSRKTVAEQLWDGVTSKCRGIIINLNTDEIVSRPFEKFHNWGSTIGQPEEVGTLDYWHLTPPQIIEKVDGFMCTLYTWDGKDYIASKGSFHSVHAKWATAEWNRVTRVPVPQGWTAVFEGLNRDLRIVVDYGNRQGLVLLALINNETGEEKPPTELEHWAKMNNVGTPTVFDKSLLDALEETTKENSMPGEGYVLTWFNASKPPTRLKLKYVEYLRLHRMVTGVSPKRVWEVLSQAHLKSELDEYLTNSTPWFNKFVSKWVLALRTEFDRINSEAHTRLQCAKVMLKDFCQKNWDNPADIRKEFALIFMSEKNREYAPVLFSMLDGKDSSVVIWKKVREMTRNGQPLVDIHNN